MGFYPSVLKQFSPGDFPCTKAVFVRHRSLRLWCCQNTGSRSHLWPKQHINFLYNVLSEPSNSLQGLGLTCWCAHKLDTPNKCYKGLKNKAWGDRTAQDIVICIESKSTAVMFGCQMLQVYSWKSVHFKDRIWLAVLSGPEEFHGVLYPWKSRWTSQKCSFSINEWLKGNDWHNYSTVLCAIKPDSRLTVCPRTSF